MRYICGTAALLLLTACAAQPVTPVSAITHCVEPLPHVCTMEYAPVCASLTAGGQKEYASHCNACADDAVAGYLTGMCPE